MEYHVSSSGRDDKPGEAKYEPGVARPDMVKGDWPHGTRPCHFMEHAYGNYIARWYEKV
jgi:hypothetical protein